MCPVAAAQQQATPVLHRTSVSGLEPVGLNESLFTAFLMSSRSRLSAKRKSGRAGRPTTDDQADHDEEVTTAEPHDDNYGGDAAISRSTDGEV